MILLRETGFKFPTIFSSTCACADVFPRCCTNAIRRRKLVSGFRVNTRRKCMAFCSFFPKFETLKANIVGMSLVHKVFIFSKSSSSIAQLSSRYRQTSIFKTPSDNMFALNHFMCCQALSPLWFSFVQQCIILIILQRFIVTTKRLNGFWL